MVNVDFASPSLLLGTGLIGCGVLLLNMRNFENKVSRDADIVVAAMVSIVGSTLIFQGWRLDPLLLLCQALTTSVAFWYGVETFRLRSKEADMAGRLLPPPGAEGADVLQQQQQQQVYPDGTPYMGQGVPPYRSGAGAPSLPPGQDAYYPWGAPSQQQGEEAAGYGGQWRPNAWGAANTYAETIAYDYYGNPILPLDSVPDAQYGDPYSGVAGGRVPPSQQPPAGSPGASPSGFDGLRGPGPDPRYGAGGGYIADAPAGPSGQQYSNGAAAAGPRPFQLGLPPNQPDYGQNGVGPSYAAAAPQDYQRQQQPPALPYPWDQGGDAQGPGGTAGGSGFLDGASNGAGAAEAQRSGVGPRGHANGGRLRLYDGSVDDWE